MCQELYIYDLLTTNTVGRILLLPFSRGGKWIFNSPNKDFQKSRLVQFQSSYSFQCNLLPFPFQPISIVELFLYEEEIVLWVQKIKTIIVQRAGRLISAWTVTECLAEDGRFQQMLAQGRVWIGRAPRTASNKGKWGFCPFSC